MYYTLYSSEIIRAREDRKREAGVSLPKKEKSSLIAAAELSPAPTSTAENTRTLTSATRKRRSKSSWYKGVVKKAARKSSQDKMEVEELADSEDLPLIPPTPEALPPKQQQSGSGSTSSKTFLLKTYLLSACILALYLSCFLFHSCCRSGEEEVQGRFKSTL
jgi:hypothetical protein